MTHGDPNLSSLAVLAMIGPSTFEHATKSARRGDGGQRSTEKARLKRMYGAVRAKSGASVSAPPAQQNLPPNGRGMETEQLPHKEFLQARRRFAVLDGDDPIEKEETTANFLL